ncbi:MAG: modification methylase [Clostridiales bacterium]|nr:modification methylase [Clostridiales bacterium]
MFNQVKLIKIKDLKPHPKNPRVHPKSALNKLIKSINEFGFTNPILVSKDGFILAGHARCKAAEQAGIEEVPAIFLDLEGVKADAYLIADNKIQEETDWNKELLADLIKDLQSLDYDTSFTGFDPPEIDALFNELYPKGVKEDGFDKPLPETPITKPGDIWILGRHRLICGDSIKLETYTALMDGKKANLIVTDPPYNVAYEGNAGKIQNDNMEDKRFYEFLLEAYKCMYENLADGGSIYVFHADKETVNFRTAFKDSGFFCHQTCIWIKNSPVLGRCDYQYNHEPVLVGWKPTAGHKFYGDRKQRTTWNFDRPTKSKYHPTMKPIALVAYPITNSSLTNSIVLDPFGGSGSTLIACEQTDRICYTIELDEKYADVIVKRYIEQAATDEGVFLIRGGVKTKYKDILKESEVNGFP